MNDSSFKKVNPHFDVLIKKYGLNQELLAGKSIDGSWRTAPYEAVV